MKDVRPLRHLASVRVSNVDKKSVEGQVPVRLCNYTDVYYGERITPDLDLMRATATPDQVDAFRLVPGDVVITKDSEDPGDIGVPAFVSASAPDLVCGYHLAVLRPAGDRTDGRYLYWAMASRPVQDHLSVSATGITRYGLRTDSISATPIPWWPIQRQRAIADFLDAEAARIDALIAKKRRLLELLDERLRRFALAAVTGEGDSGGERWTPGPHWLPSVPRSWRPEKIAWRKTTASGTTPESGSPVYYAEADGTPWITTSELRETVIQEARRLVTPDAFRDYSALQVFPAGTVLIAMYGATVGRLGVLGVPAATNQACCALFGGPDLDQRFLYWWLWANRDHLVSMAYGAGQPNISQDLIRGLRVPAPPPPEQRSVTLVIEREAERTEGARRLLSQQVDLLVEHRQALITAAVTGELAVPGVAA